LFINRAVSFVMVMGLHNWRSAVSLPSICTYSAHLTTHYKNKRKLKHDMLLAIIYTYVYKYVSIYEYVTPIIYMGHYTYVGHINITLPHPRITLLYILYIRTVYLYVYAISTILSKSHWGTGSNILNIVRLKIHWMWMCLIDWTNEHFIVLLTSLF